MLFCFRAKGTTLQALSVLALALSAEAVQNRSGVGRILVARPTEVASIGPAPKAPSRCLCPAHVVNNSTANTGPQMGHATWWSLRLANAHTMLTRIFTRIGLEQNHHSDSQTWRELSQIRV